MQITADTPNSASLDYKENRRPKVFETNTVQSFCHEKHFWEEFFFWVVAGDDGITTREELKK